MFTTDFWAAAFERAAKTACQAAILVTGAGAFDVWEVDWRQVLGMAAGGFVVSILTSVGSAPIGPTGSPSLIDIDTPDESF